MPVGLPTPWRTISFAIAALAALTFAVTTQKDWVLYNHSPSLPVGLYARTAAPITRAAIVTVRAIDVAPEFARQRHFTGPGDRFIKRVAAIAGDRVCANADTLTINSRVVAHRARNDSMGQTLPTWSGCRVLDAGDLLLLGDTSDSFDSRYWGVVSRRKIEGVWRPLRF